MKSSVWTYNFFNHKKISRARGKTPQLYNITQYIKRKRFKDNYFITYNISYMEYKCYTCNKNYASYQSLWIHNKKFHDIKAINNSKSKSKSSINVSNNIQQNDSNFVCEHCSNQFSRNDNLKRHYNTCKKIQDQKQKNDNTILYQEIEKLKEEIEKLKKKQNKKIINIGSINTLNNNNNKIINICGFGEEDINLLLPAEKQHIIDQGLNSIISLAEHLNFNEKIPQHHIFYTSAINDKYVNVYDKKTNTIVKKSKKEIYDITLINYLTKLEQIHKDTKIKPKQFAEKLNTLKSFIFQKKGKNEFHNQLNMISYNNKNLISSTWNQLLTDDNVTVDKISEKYKSEIENISELDDVEFSEDSDIDSSEDSDIDNFKLVSKKINKKNFEL